MSITQLRIELRDALGVDENDLSKDAADLLLNRSYWELLDKFPFREKEATVTFNTIAGTRNYDMPSPFEAVVSISIEDLSSFQHTRLEYMDPRDYEGQYVGATFAHGVPIKYTREGCFARLWPTPDQVYKMTLKYLAPLADLSDTNTSAKIPQSWDDILLLGAVWRGFMKYNDWSRVNAAKAHQISLINSQVPTQAKEERDTSFAGLNVASRPYDNNYGSHRGSNGTGRYNRF